MGSLLILFYPKVALNTSHPHDLTVWRLHLPPSNVVSPCALGSSFFPQPGPSFTTVSRTGGLTFAGGSLHQTEVKMADICTRDTRGLVFGDLLFFWSYCAGDWADADEQHRGVSSRIPDILPLPSYPS